MYVSLFYRPGSALSLFIPESPQVSSHRYCYDTITATGSTGHRVLSDRLSKLPWPYMWAVSFTIISTLSDQDFSRYINNKGNSDRVSCGN
jgi:hypothetical protein